MKPVVGLEREAVYKCYSTTDETGLCRPERGQGVRANTAELQPKSQRS